MNRYLKICVSKKCLLAVVVTMVASSPSTAAEVHRGSAMMIDGDTIKVQGLPVNVRLYGIDAPEGEQTCVNKLGAPYDCGNEAAEHLKSLLQQDARITCTELDRDRYGRIVAECITGSGLNLNREMVEAGWAIEFDRYSDGRYGKAQGQAKVGARGLWAGSFDAPASWRRASRKGQATGVKSGALVRNSKSPDCPIKGNISSSGQIYHVPGQADYDKTRIDETNGERWFCSAAEAEAAGWRAAKR